MLNVIVILDQIQSGLGGKEKAGTPYGGKKIAMGSADTIEREIEKKSGKVLGTFYCGTDYYEQNKKIVQNKFAKMTEKMEANVVIAGPTYDYPEFSRMACELADYIEKNTKTPVILAIAQEKNANLIEEYKDKLTIVKMPKKGGIGLSKTIKNLTKGCEIIVNGDDKDAFKTEFCY